MKVPFLLDVTLHHCIIESRPFEERRVLIFKGCNVQEEFYVLLTVHLNIIIQIIQLGVQFS